MKTPARPVLGLLLVLLLAAGCTQPSVLPDAVTHLLAQAPDSPLSAPDSPLGAPVSPLVEPALVTYRGATAYTGMSPIELAYDAQLWRYVDDPDAPALIHATFAPCTLLLRQGGTEALYQGEIDLGEWHWFVLHYGPGAPDILLYTVLLDPYAAAFALEVPPTGAAAARAACMADAEAVLATFVTTDPAVHPTSANQATEAPFAVTDATGWPVFATPFFTLQHPPGWASATQPKNLSSGYWEFTGILPTSLAAHFQVRPSVWVVREANPEGLPLADWVERQPPGERASVVIESRALTLGTQPALMVEHYFDGVGDTLLVTWTACGDAIVQISTGGALRDDLQNELEQIYMQMVDSFRCAQSE